MNRRDDIERELQALGALDVPGPDDSFVDALEARLLGDEAVAGPVIALAPRRGRRMSAAAMVAASLAFTGAAAAAGVVVIARPFHDEPAPATSTTTPVTEPSSTTTTTVAPTSTVDVTTPVPTTAPATAPPTTVPATVPPPPSTVPPTTAKPEPPRTTVAITTTTEVKVPPTMTLECFLEAGSVHCRWSAGPDGTVQYAILRSTIEPVSNTATYVGPGDLLWIDPVQSPGVMVGYLIQALDANGKSLAHTPLVKIACC